MNTKSILASLVLLGSSSAAMASPGVVFSNTPGSSYGTAVLRDHRVDPVTEDCDDAPAPIAQPVNYNDGDQASWPRRWLPPVYRPVTLASSAHFAGDGRTFIGVGSRRGQFGTLHINAAAGRTLIKQVYVQFANGQEQVIRNLDRTLAGNQSLTIDLDGGRRSINRIVVYGGSVSPWRRSAAGTFTVTAS
jgi:hypothetical protein